MFEMAFAVVNGRAPEKSRARIRRENLTSHPESDYTAISFLRMAFVRAAALTLTALVTLTAGSAAPAPFGAQASAEIAPAASPGATVFTVETGPGTGLGIIDPAGGYYAWSDPMPRVSRPFILPQKIAFSESDGKIAFFDGRETVDLKMLDGLRIIDAECFDAGGGSLRFVLLVSDGKFDYLNFLKYEKLFAAPGAGRYKSAVVGADNSSRVSTAAHTRIAGASGDAVYLFAPEGFLVEGFRINAATGASEKIASAAVDEYGARLAPPPSGSAASAGAASLYALKVSEGAVNTLLCFDAGLSLRDSSLVLSGETGPVIIEAVLRDGIVIASATDYYPSGEARRRFFAADTFGRVCPIASFGRFDYCRQAMSDGENLYLIEARRLNRDEKTGAVNSLLAVHGYSREDIAGMLDSHYSRAGRVSPADWQSFKADFSPAEIDCAAVSPAGVGIYIFTRKGLYYNDKLMPLELPVAVSPGGPSVQAFSGAVFGADGKLYVRLAGGDRVARITCAGGTPGSFETVELKPPADLKAAVRLEAGRSSELYLTDPAAFSALKFSPGGIFEGALAGRAFAACAPDGTLLCVRESGGEDAGNAPARKSLLAFDGGAGEGGSRALTDFFPGASGLAGGAFCAGADKKGRAYFMCFARGSLIVRSCATATGETIKETAVKFPGVRGRLITSGYRVTEGGLIVFATAADGPGGRAAVTVHSIDIY